MHLPKLPASSRTQGHLRRMGKDGGTGQMGWHRGLEPSEGILVWGLDPRLQQFTHPAVQGPVN